MMFIMEELKYNRNRASTRKNYLAIWRKFNKFLIRIDHKPKYWEDRVALFVAYLAQSHRKSTTVRSYISAIKSILRDDGYVWDDNKAQLNVLTRGCKLINDKVKTRLPIQIRLLDLMIFETERMYSSQMYLMRLYKAMLVFGYYGLLRVGEMTLSEHTIKAANVHIGSNKWKILIVLYTSKTHGLNNRPQKIKITTNSMQRKLSVFCPFKIAIDYLNIRGDYCSVEEPFFVMTDRSPVTHIQFRNFLRTNLKNLNLNSSLYDCTSLRSGRATDLEKFQFPISEIKRMGRWKSNAVYKYFRQ